MQRIASWFLAGALLAAGCGDEAAPPPMDVPAADTHAALDAPPDAPPPDTTPDTAAPDAALDAGPRDVPPPDTGARDTGAATLDVPPATDTGPRDATPDRPLLDVPADTGPAFLAGPTGGSAIALTPDGLLALVANRTARSLAVMAYVGGATPVVSRLHLLATGDGSEPWQVAIGPDGDTGYAILRGTRRAIKVTGLHGVPVIAAAAAATGAEPTGLALAPSGRRLYVANWGEGTVTVVDTTAMTVVNTIDLNATLAATGMLGAVAARPGLAHPRAVVVTNDGDRDESDEALYVTEFFGQRRLAGAPTTLARFDQDRVGVVYRVPLATGRAEVRTLAPVADIGLRDATNTAAGCVPNQLHAAAISNGRVYVTAGCASPRGPVGPSSAAAPADVANFKTLHTAALFVLDAATGNERPAERVLLNPRFQALYDARRTPDDATRRMPLVPVALAFSGTTAYVAAYGADALFRVRFNTTGSFAEAGAGAALPPYVDLAPEGLDPVGVAINPSGANALVVSEHSRAVSVAVLATQTAEASTAAAPAPTGAELTTANGRRAFVTGTGRWSLRGQAWSSCESCHPDGLSDGVTWFLPRGPRQTPSLAGAFDRADPTRQRIFGWTAALDELADFEGFVRDVSGGVGAIVHRPHDGATPPVISAADRIVYDGAAPTPPQVATADAHDGLDGAAATIATRTATDPVRSALDDWDALLRYVRAVRAPAAPADLDEADVAAGRAVFVEGRCAGCHGGPLWSLARRFYTPGEATNDPVRGTLATRSWTRPAGFPAALAPATARFRTTPLDPANDQLACALRTVGTFAAGRGVAPTGVDVLEVRANGLGATTAPMTAAAQGATGFAPPSLVGLAASAPYLHAGQARTLEELLTATFRAHHQAFNGAFLAAEDPARVRRLVAFLLSLDDRATPVAVPDPLPGTAPFDPDLCGLF